MPILGWRRLRRLGRDEASTLTRGDLDKFLNKDYYKLIDTTAVYLHDGEWWLVRKEAL